MRRMLQSTASNSAACRGRKAKQRLWMQEALVVADDDDAGKLAMVDDRAYGLRALRQREGDGNETMFTGFEEIVERVGGFACSGDWRSARREPAALRILEFGVGVGRGLPSTFGLAGNFEGGDPGVGARADRTCRRFGLDGGDAPFVEALGLTLIEKDSGAAQTETHEQSGVHREVDSEEARRGFQGSRSAENGDDQQADQSSQNEECGHDEEQVGEGHSGVPGSDWHIHSLL